MSRAFLLVLLSTAWTASALAGTTPSLFDVHSHYTTADAERFSPEQIVAILDREGIERMLIIGEPAQRALELRELAPDRFIPLLGLYTSYRDKADWALDPTLPERLRTALAGGGYAGIGELHLFRPMRKSPVFREVVGMAREHRMPLLIHGDPAVVDQAFEWAPELTVLWAHLGTDPRPVAVRRMLERHPQRLYVDTSVRDERFLDEHGVLKAEWRDLFIDHADRLMIGIDTFSTSRWEEIDKVTARIRGWLAQLPPEVAAKLAHGNARRLFPAAAP
ncbi:MAG: amidohydrolase family protein [Chromatiales bacterium]|nr:amidohydrolase family protein [Chromatiales bacterium]